MSDERAISKEPQIPAFQGVRRSMLTFIAKKNPEGQKNYEK
ncbi:MAG: hypothetical protein ACOH5I_06625 [Oligoflexus sp.]